MASYRDRQHTRIVTLSGTLLVLGLTVILYLLLGSPNGPTLALTPGSVSFAICGFALFGMVVALHYLNGSANESKRATELAYVDELTGLPNRRQFTLRLKQELARAARHENDVAVMYFDLDRLKEINDLYGHEAGDTAIIEFGRRLTAVIRAHDVVARLSGDEFAAIVTEIENQNDPVRVADRAIQAMKEPIRIGEKSIYATVSIGATTVVDGSIEAAEALRRADFALLQAKSDGRNRLQIYDPEMAERAKEKRKLEAALHQMVDEASFYMDYQPLMSHGTSQLMGVEALLRWDHRELGKVSPGEFIPLAEELGVINELGELALRRACQDIRDIDGIKLAVNVSPVQFRQDGFVAMVKDVLLETQFPAKRLELEITEGVFITEPAKTVETIKAVRALGVSIALDDFGTGYSSMSYLREFPLDRIKIDRSFVSKMSESMESLSIVSTMIELGGALGLSVTVEGVETQHQLDLLKKSNCTEVQGFLFAKPMSAEDLEAMCRDVGLIGPKSEVRLAS